MSTKINLDIGKTYEFDNIIKLITNPLMYRQYYNSGNYDIHKTVEVFDDEIELMKKLDSEGLNLCADPNDIEYDGNCIIISTGYYEHDDVCDELEIRNVSKKFIENFEKKFDS